MGTMMAFNKIPGLPSWPIMLIHTIPRLPSWPIMLIHTIPGLPSWPIMLIHTIPRTPVGAGEAWRWGGDACVAPVLLPAPKNLLAKAPVGAGEAWKRGGDACVAPVLLAKAPVGADLSRPPPIYRPAGDFPCPDSFVNDMIPLIFETSSLRPFKET
jgi:hypothetical protein